MFSPRGVLTSAIFGFRASHHQSAPGQIEFRHAAQHELLELITLLQSSGAEIVPFSAMETVQA